MRCTAAIASLACLAATACSEFNTAETSSSSSSGGSGASATNGTGAAGGSSTSASGGAGAMGGSGGMGGTNAAGGSGGAGGGLQPPVPTGNYQWHQTMRVGSPSGYVRSESITSDIFGNVIVASSYLEQLTIGTDVYGSNDAQQDAFIAKFDSAGVLQWSDASTQDKIQAPQAVATDSQGNILVGGYFRDALQFSNTTLLEGNFDQAFLLKLTTAGQEDWGKAYGSAGNGAYLQDIAIDAQDNIFFVANYRNTITVDTCAENATGTSDILVAKLTPTGKCEWTWTRNYDVYNKPTGITMTKGGDVVVCGHFGMYDDPPANHSVFLTKLDGATGVPIWQLSSFANNGDTRAFDVAADAAGTIVVTGNFDQTVNFGGSTLTASFGTSAAEDIFIAQFDDTGAYQWSKAIGDSAIKQTGYGVAIDPWGNLVVSGWANTGSLPQWSLSPPSSSRSFLAKLSMSDGSFIWGTASLGFRNAARTRVALTAAGEPVVFGAYGIDATTSTGWFDPDGNGDVAAGASDVQDDSYAFIVKYDP